MHTLLLAKHVQSASQNLASASKHHVTCRVTQTGVCTTRSLPRQTATDCIQEASGPPTTRSPPSPLWAFLRMKAGFFFSWLQSASAPSLEPVTHSVPVTYLQIVPSSHRSL